MSAAEKTSLLSSNNEEKSHERRHSSSSGEWSNEDGSSYSSSIYSHTNSNDSFINEWESYVADDKRLFYIETSAHVGLKSEKNVNSLSAAKNQFSRASTRRSNKGLENWLSL